MARMNLHALKVSKVYPLYVAKAEKKGRSRDEVDQVLCWLTGYDQAGLQRQLAGEADFDTFFAQAPQLHPNRGKITGMICGVRVEEIEDPFMQTLRQIDKLVDELARGRPMEKILRS